MPSIRAIAKELGISHSYLSYLVNGKRPWSPDLYNRYQQLVTTPPSVVTTSQPNLNTKTRDPLLDTGSFLVAFYSGACEDSPSPRRGEGDACSAREATRMSSAKALRSRDLASPVSTCSISTWSSCWQDALLHDATKAILLQSFRHPNGI